jgi:DNA-binding NtrC family response regulator
VEKSVLVVLVEDEAMIRMIVQDALEEAGFEVAPAGSVQEALSVLGQGKLAIGALVTDIRLGAGPDGWEIARHARTARPDLPVVYMSGDSAADWPSQGVPQSQVVQKPFAVAQIVTAVTNLMNDQDNRDTRLRA